MCDHLLCEIVDRAMANPTPTSPHQSRLRSILVGDRAAVRGRILELHRLGVTEVGAWSELLPIPNTEEVISIHTQRRRRKPAKGDRAKP